MEFCCKITGNKMPDRGVFSDEPGLEWGHEMEWIELLVIFGIFFAIRFWLARLGVPT